MIHFYKRYSLSVTMAGSSGGDHGVKSPAHRKETTGGAWGPASRPRGGQQGTSVPTYSSIASINTSVRDSKNILEVRLERQEGSTFNLTMENLLRRLKIDSDTIKHVLVCSRDRSLAGVLGEETDRYPHHLHSCCWTSTRQSPPCPTSKHAAELQSCSICR